MADFYVTYRRQQEKTIAVMATTAREALKAASDELARRVAAFGDDLSGWHPEWVETDRIGRAVLGACESCDTPILEGDDYSNDEDGDLSCCGPCARELAAQEPTP